MTTTAAVEKKEEKVEKRRALGRGLESLLGRARLVPVPAGGSVTTAEPATPLQSPLKNSAENAAMAPVEVAAMMDNPAAAAEPHSAGQPGAAGVISISGQAEPQTLGNIVVQIPIDHIRKNPYQTRNLFEKETLAELAESIQANGVLQPIVVRPGDAEGDYILVLGERRHRAAKMAGKETIPAIVRRVSEQQAAEMTVIENLQRQDLNCIEQAEAFRVLSQQFNLTQEQIGKRVGLSRESVSNYMRLLKLPEKVMGYLATNQMSFSEARELMHLADPSLIESAADSVVKHKLTLQKIEEMVAKLNGWSGSGESKQDGGGSRWIDPNVRAAQTDLERLLGVRVRIKDRRGKGKIVIEYSTVDDYERVVGMLRGKE